MAHTDYEWAVNKVKLQQSHEALVKAGNKAPSEDEVKAEYVKRAGLVRESAADAADEPETLQDLSVPQLKKLAGEKEVDVTGLSKKADLIAALEAAGVSI